jgi:hypothetical protein
MLSLTRKKHAEIVGYFTDARELPQEKTKKTKYLTVAIFEAAPN